MTAGSAPDPSSADQMLKAIRALVPPGAVVEMRVPEYGGRKANTASGYFDDLQRLINDARQADGKAAGLYFTMNPVKPELLARRVNRSEQYAKLTTADHDIQRRRWILIDIDPNRPAGICSTDAEHEAALSKTIEITDYLSGLGFPEPARMDSGNGAYLLYPVDMPNDDASRGLIQSFLNALGERFNDDVIKIDTSVYNAARIMRIPGTTNTKGDNTPERPHRRARLLSVPEHLVTVEPELLPSVAVPEQAASAGTTTSEKPTTYAPQDVTADIEWMRQWLESHELETRNDEPWKGTGHRWELEICPFNPDHDRGEAWVCIMPSGAKAGGCRHDSCTWKWSDLRAKVEPTEANNKVPTEAAGDGQRPRVDIRNDADAADWLRAELGRGRLVGIFRRDDQLVHTPRMGEEGYLPPQDLGLIDAGPAQVRPITTAGVKSLVETRYRPWRTKTVRDGGETTTFEIAALFPQQSAQSACEAARLGEHAPNLKTLHGVTHTPMMRPDGSILDVPGYDAATRFLYLPDPDLTMPPIPNQPAREQVEAAVELILTPVAEFPFVSSDDRATWIGLAFTPALRPLLPGPYQMGVITATNPGSGKTLLSKMITTIHGGVQRGELPRDADELRKSITAALIDTTAPVITFDNLTGVVRSSVLESLLTSKTWTDRYLGQNKSVTATNDRLWLATGNNAAFGGDLARRIDTVALDPPEANPHLRTNFKIKNLDAWMLEHRGELLAAMLTIARGWIVAGRPSAAVRSDDYAPWVNGLRGMLGWAGFPGVFGGGCGAMAMSADDEEWHAFLVEIHGAFGTDPFTVKDLVGELRDPFLGGRIDAAALPGDLAEKWSHIREGREGGFRKSLGWWLKNRAGRYASGWTLVAAESDTKAKVARYTVKPPGHAGPGAGQNSTDGGESAGFRGFTGFDPATGGFKTSNNGVNSAPSDRPGENRQNPETPPGEKTEPGATYSRDHTLSETVETDPQR
jgi:hypothetical protein